MSSFQVTTRCNCLNEKSSGSIKWRENPTQKTTHKQSTATLSDRQVETKTLSQVGLLKTQYEFIVLMILQLEIYHFIAKGKMIFLLAGDY